MTRLATILALTASLLAIAPAASAEQASTSSIKNIVLVHGAWADGTGWRGVHDILVRDGYTVSIVQQPLTGLADDVAATARVLAQQTGPVVLVGHSYGGQVITDAGVDPDVKALVYVAALQGDVGDSVVSLASTMPAPNQDVRPSADGFLTLDRPAFPADFAADIPAADSAFMAASQMPIAAAAFNDGIKVASWKTKPSWSIVATEDHALSPDLQRWMYARAGARVTELVGSHAIFISQPQAVVDVIEAAANGAH